MKIAEFALSRLRNEEHFQFHTSFRDLVLTTGPSILKIETQFPDYEVTYDNEREALNIIRKSLISDELVVADIERDEVVHGFEDAVKSGLNHFNAEVRTSARRLQVLLDTYGNVAEKSYEAETGALKGLVKELTTTFAPDMATATLTGWTTAIDAKNKAFDDLKNLRYTDEAAKTTLRMKQERVKTDASCRRILERINALIVVEGDAAYAGFAKEMNERIYAYNNTIANRKAKGKESSETDTDNP